MRRRAILIVALLITLGLGSCAAQTAGSAQHHASLSWTASGDAGVTYNVYRMIGACPATGAMPAAVKIGSAEAGVVTFSDADVVAGMTYCYTVRATNGTAESADSNYVSGTIPLLPVILSPLVTK